MTDKAVVRRLAAILVADVVGYSRLMEIDEVGTLTALKSHRRDLIDPAIAGHHGRIVKTTGDGLLLEFASVVDAIGCAVAVQRGMLRRNAAVSESKRIVFRVGVNIGDIIIEDGDIFGDGVNVAARLEVLCEPGGICISRAANEQIRDKLSLSFADLGEHAVKNISRAVGVYGLTAQDIAALPDTPMSDSQPGSDALLTAPPSLRSRSMMIAASSALLAVLVAGAAVWWSRGSSGLTPSDPTPHLQSRLTAAIEKSLPKMPGSFREQQVEAFATSKPHRAMAVAQQAQRTWRTSAWPSREIAEERVLEKCQQFYDEPCGLIASSDFIATANAAGSFPVRDAPRVRYGGLFNPERIPAIRDDIAQRMDVAGYPTAASPKASAFHAAGILHVVTGAPSQRSAEEQALRACNDDPIRKTGGGGPCYLYSVDNRVVLPLRATDAITTATPQPALATPGLPPIRSPVPSARAAEAGIRDALLTALGKMAPAYSYREQQVRQYLESNGHKALAVYPPSGSWRTRGWDNALVAEECVLEACQVRFGGPCILLAVNDAVHVNVAEANGPRRSMPRVSHDGPFDPNQLPAASQEVRRRTDVAGYREALEPKAAAIHPWGRLFVVTQAATQLTAEEQALGACNGDPDRDGKDGPCLLYAIGNQVVLPRRSLVAITAQ